MYIYLSQTAGKLYTEVFASHRSGLRWRPFQPRALQGAVQGAVKGAVEGRCWAVQGAVQGAVAKVNR